MVPLKLRIEEVMQSKNWKIAAVARAAKVSHSAVSQWLGRGNTHTETINSTAAANLADASGFNAVWLATGKGPKLVSAESSPADTASGLALSATSTTGELSVAQHLQALGQVIASSDELTRAQIKPILDQLLKTPEQADDLGQRLQATVSMRSGQTPFVPNNPFPKK